MYSRKTLAHRQSKHTETYIYFYKIIVNKSFSYYYFSKINDNGFSVMS